MNTVALPAPVMASNPYLANHEEIERRTSNQSKCLDRISIFIYLSHFLSSFGDRVWQFAVGLYLYYIYPCSLLLTAIYGFATCGSLFLLGAPVGRWIDKSKRLKAARISILVQNLAVVLSAAIMASAIYYKTEIRILWNGYLQFALYASIIIIEIVAELASMANKLVLEKDWIVVLARGDQQRLSNLNATMRTISLTCKIVAPFVVGHLLHLFSYLAGAIFIACWNVVSAVAEYYLLYLIFSLVPELSAKKADDNLTLSSSSGQHGTHGPNNGPTSPKSNSQNKVEDPAGGELAKERGSLIYQFTPEMYQGVSTNDLGAGVGPTNNGNTGGLLAITSGPGEAKQEEGNSPVAVAEDGRMSLSRMENKDLNGNEGEGNEARTHETQARRKCNYDLGKSCEGWKVYFTHPVRFAGLGLAFLYMTVLSFDYVTIGYLSSQGVSPAVSGNLTAVASLIGILGSLCFPFFRKRLGKNTAGIFGFGMETFCLLFCVASIIAPGSPFNPEAIKKVTDVGGSGSCKNHSGTGAPSLSIKEQWDQHSNIFLLILGIVSARYGLWIADLSVTQIFQENVKESQRGAVGGVQGSLNQLMSLVKFGLTIILPYPDTFGYLICLSWLFVFFGWILFSIFVCHDRKQRKMISSCAERGSQKDILLPSNSNSK